MRGDDLNQSAMFSYISPEQRVPANHPRRPIRWMADTALGRLSPLFERLYSRLGRPSIAPEKLLRALLLQLLFTVPSERPPMERLACNLLFRWFVGLLAPQLLAKTSRISRPWHPVAATTRDTPLEVCRCRPRGRELWLTIGTFVRGEMP